MDQVENKLYTTLRDDATIKGLTGYTTSDVRVYPAFEDEEHKITATRPAYITYHKVADTPSFMDLENEIYQIDIYSESHATNISIYNRIDTLLNDQTISPASGTVSKIHRETNKPLWDDNRKLKRYMIQYRIYYYG